MKLQLNTLGGGLIMAVGTIVLIALILFAFITAYPPHMTQTQLEQEAVSIWGNMTLSEQSHAYMSYRALCGGVFYRYSHSFEQFLVDYYEPMIPPKTLGR